MAIMNAFPAGGGGGAVREIVERTISRYQDKTITFVGSYAFAGCVDLSYVSLPQLSSVGNYAFYGCTSLESIEFPNLSTAGDSAFTGCTSLEAISLPMYTGNSKAFSGFNSTSALRYVSLPKYGSTSIPVLNAPLTHLCLGCVSIDTSFAHPETFISLVFSNLTHFSNQSGFTALEYLEIGGSTFDAYVPAWNVAAKIYSFPNLTAFTDQISASKTEFFWNNRLKIQELYAPKLSAFKTGDNFSGWFVFGSSYTALKSVNLHNASFSYNISSVFASCPNLEYVDITNANYVAPYMFYSCSKLQNIRLEKVQSLYGFGFGGCSKLESIYILTSTVPSLSTYVFNNTPIVNSTYLGRFGSIFVKSSMVNAFKTNASWASYSDRITAYTG